MKIKSIIASAALLGVLASSASAITTLDPVKAAQPVKFDAPAPVTVVAPVQMPHFHKGPDVTLRMTIDENGQPHNVRVAGTSDQKSYKHLVAAVSQWKFTPGRKDGKAVTTRVELPLEVKGL
jgi:TonB family protein